MTEVYFFKIPEQVRFNSRDTAEQLIKKRFGFKEDLVITTNNYGKPILQNKKGIYFNISHTKEVLVIGISTCNIGIDIEKRQYEDLRVVKRMYTQNEGNYVTSQTLRQRRRFYEIWTKKEAYLKWLGTGMYVPLNKIDVLSSSISKKLYTYHISEFTISICCSIPAHVIYLLEKSE